MSINNIETAINFQTVLDDIMVHEALTGYMEANAGMVKYNGGKKIMIPKLNLDGLADYDDGFEEGSISFEYEEREMTQDRGREFTLDEMSVDETNFALTAGRIMSEFQRTEVIPEIDAYRISKLATAAITAGNVHRVTEDMKVDPLIDIKEAISVIRDKGCNSDLVCHISYETLFKLEVLTRGNLSNVTFEKTGFDTRVPILDGVPLIGTPRNRMYTAITINDGKTEGQKKGGYAKATTGKDINFLIVARNAPIAVSKQDKTRIFDPETYQKKRAWKMDYRHYHDLWIKDNAVNSIFVSIKDTV